MYRQQIAKKTSLSSLSTTINKQTIPTPSYGSLSVTIQRAAASPESLREDEWLQLHKAIGTRATNEIKSGRRTSYVPEFKGISAQFQDNSGQVDAPIQKKDDVVESEVQPENKTGLPDNLKAGVETLSGYSLDNVRVHYNSSKPAQLQAHAYTQGTQIHVAPGQEKHLSHETWHVVQQKRGDVKPTLQLKTGQVVNDDNDLEREADKKANQALKTNHGSKKLLNHKRATQTSDIVQRVIKIKQHERTVEEIMKLYYGKDKDGKERVEELLYTTGITINYIKKVLERFSSKGREFNNVQHLESAVLNEVLQSFFYDDYHQERETNPRKVREVKDKSGRNLVRMRMYRTMDVEEFAELCEWCKKNRDVASDLIVSDPLAHKEVEDEAKKDKAKKDDNAIQVKNHLGGYAQANSFFTRGRGGEGKKSNKKYYAPKFLVEFTLKPNAPVTLDDPTKIVLTTGDTTNRIKKRMENLGQKPKVLETSGEGTDGKNIGIKSEKNAVERGERLSISLGKGKGVRGKFQEMVDKITLIKGQNSNGDTYTENSREGEQNR